MVTVMVVGVVACAGSAAIWAQSAARRLGAVWPTAPAPAARRAPFKTPAGGRAVRRALAGRFGLCTLLRRDGSRFALLHIVRGARPRGGVLSALRGAVERGRPLLRRGREEPGEREVRQLLEASIGSGTGRRRGSGGSARRQRESNRDAVVRRSGTRRASGRTTSTGAASRTRRSHPPPTRGRRRTTADTRDGKSVIDWGNLRTIRTAPALACTFTWYDGKGNPIESDIRFNTADKWSTTGASGAFDIQSIAAHEIGHVLQFDHVTNASKDDETNADVAVLLRVTRAAASSAAATRSRTTATTDQGRPLLAAGSPVARASRAARASYGTCRAHVPYRASSRRGDDGTQVQSSVAGRARQR